MHLHDKIKIQGERIVAYKVFADGTKEVVKSSGPLTFSEWKKLKKEVKDVSR